MNVSFTVDTDTLSETQRRGLAMLLADEVYTSETTGGVVVHLGDLHGSVGGEQSVAPIPRSEVSLKVGDEVTIRGANGKFQVTAADSNVWSPPYVFEANDEGYTHLGLYYADRADGTQDDIISINGRPIVED